jgi:hypothetical protein
MDAKLIVCLNDPVSPKQAKTKYAKLQRFKT